VHAVFDSQRNYRVIASLQTPVIIKNKIALSSFVISLDHAYFFLSYDRLSCNTLCELSMRTFMRTFSFTLDRCSTRNGCTIYIT